MYDNLVETIGCMNIQPLQFIYSLRGNNIAE